MIKYWDYLSHAKIDTVQGCYAAVLEPYSNDHADTSAANLPAYVALIIYAVVQEGIPAAFLQWSQG